MPITQTSSQLTTQTRNIVRTKYFPIELYCKNMLPNTTYDAYINGQLVNSFCKPFGGKLGSPLTSDITGTLRAQYMHAVIFNQTFLVPPNTDNNNLIESNLTITLIDPFNRSSTASIPILLKSGRQ